MRLLLTAIALGACLAGASIGSASNQKPIVTMKGDAMFRKLGPRLYSLTRIAQPAQAPRARTAIEAQVNRLLRFDSQRQCVVVDVIAAQDTATLVSVMKERGMRDMTRYGRVVSGCVSISALESVTASEAVRFLQPSTAITHVGLVTTQGDRSMRADEVRDNLGVDGRDVRVGVLSDSFECRQGPLLVGNPFTTVTEDITNDDLPPDVIVLSDITSEDCIDEGRAILQLIHDVAPGAAGAFHTAFNGRADFAMGILELAHQAGSDVIVDDVIYIAEPMFADGIIAQAANTVKGWGSPTSPRRGTTSGHRMKATFVRQVTLA